MIHHLHHYPHLTPYILLPYNYTLWYTPHTLHTTTPHLTPYIPHPTLYTLHPTILTPDPKHPIIEVDPPSNLSRIRMVVTLLDGCGIFVDKGKNKEKLSIFLIYFQVWIYYEYIILIWFIQYNMFYYINFLISIIIYMIDMLFATHTHIHSYTYIYIYNNISPLFSSVIFGSREWTVAFTM